MSIKTGRIRRLYDETLEKNLLCDNMLLMAISAVNHEICFNERLTNKQVINYQSYRTILAKTALDNGIGKEKIAVIMQALSSEHYPSNLQITKLITLIKSKSYSYHADYIPDSDLKYLTELEQQEQRQKVIKRNQAQLDKKKQLKEICDYIDDNFIHSPITADMQAKLAEIKADNETIHKALKWYKNDINKALSGKEFNCKYDKISYIVAIVKKKIPEMIEYLEYRKKKEEFLRNTDFSRVNEYKNNFQSPPTKKRKKNYDDMW